QAIRCPHLGDAGREAEAKRGVLGGGAKADAHGELGVGSSGKIRLASIRGVVPDLWLRSEKWPATFRTTSAARPTRGTSQVGRCKRPGDRAKVGLRCGIPNSSPRRHS